MNQSRSLASILILVVSPILLAGMVWADIQTARLNFSGEEFSIQWFSILSLAKTGSNPYDNQVTGQIQANVPREAAFVEDLFPRYTSPLYSGAIIFPFTLLSDKTLAHAVWMTVQIIIIFTIPLICIKLSGWRPAWYSFALYAIFTFFSYHVVIPWLSGGLSIWAAFFMLLALVMISTKRDELGGVFLALAAIQPQMVILPAIFILAWSVSKKRSVILAWFFITLILLSVIGLFLVPNWIVQYARLLFHYASTFPPGSPGLFFISTWPGLGKQLSWLASGLVIVLLVFEWILARKKDFRWFLWTVCLTMVLSQWIGIPTVPSNFIELIIPAVLISAMLSERWPTGGQWIAILSIVVLFVWEWSLYYLDLASSQPALQINLIFPLPAILLIGLYWVRWWAIRPRRLLIEELRLSETY